MARDLCIASRQGMASGAPVAALGGDAGPMSTEGEARAGAAVVPPILPPPVEPDQAEQPERRRIRGGLPHRNPDFTGRETMLRALRESLLSKISVLPQTLHGFGGVGKTQLAVEYIYRFLDEYDLVWWIPAEQQTLVLQSLAALSRQLGMQEMENLQERVDSVLTTLASSDMRWLLVFDNANQPEDLSRFMPSVGGHVVITSRNHEWSQLGGAIEVDVFDREESIELIRKRGKDISPADADRLAEKLGDLPLALEQAATWQSGTGMPVGQYLELFDQHVQELLSEGKPTSYPTTVAAFLHLAVERLRNESPASAELFELFAFLGAEPVPANLLRAGREAALSEPLRHALRDPIRMNRAIRELRRSGLARVDHNVQFMQVHRLMQLILRDGMSEDESRRSLSNVQRLLAAANPGDPDEQPTSWERHAEIGPHILPANLIAADLPDARQLVLNQARYLYLSGDYENSRRLAEIAVDVWQRAEGEGLGLTGQSTLLAMRHLANAMRSLGLSKEARELTLTAYEGMRNNPELGENHEYTLITANGVALDLRIQGNYRAALAVDRENVDRTRAVFGDEDGYTLRALNNVAVNLRMLGQLDDAYGIDADLVRQWSRTVGPNRYQTLQCEANAARDLLAMGLHDEALTLVERVVPGLREEFDAHHPYVLLAGRTYVIALMRVGQFQEATAHAREIYLGTRARLGPNHEHTLAMAMTLANTLRATGLVTEAFALAEEAVNQFRINFGPEHPLTLCAEVNLAVLLRAQGDHQAARRLDEHAVEGFTTAFSDDHTYTLRTASNLSNDLAYAGRGAAALEISQGAYDRLLVLRGDRHPHTLGAAANVAFDRLAVGDETVGQQLLESTLAIMAEVLGQDHPGTLDTARGKRTECDLEPSPT
jgi:tetratricopeptide (TPR) repeat protein